MTAALDRPRTLDEAKDFLRQRLAERRSPMTACDADAVRATLDRLEGLDPEPWGGGAHFGFQPDWVARSRYADSYLMDLIPTRAHMLGLTGYDEYVARVPSLSLLDQGILDQPSAPLLLVNGKDDRQTPIADLYIVLEHGDPKSARVFPGGHMGDTPDTLPTIVRWLCDRVASH